ncbi:hypothetical protein GRI62_01320 [Erythrobacter arachoides]|uniref:Uncharacterized protein n=1 Tax=Aurantiacibacter arachoides TaxID=1850444 RepID=A0A844ZZT7_9SPHN|nr:hypothetical protein [Aurantiacibacter arachoides]MXO92247.1 hypothetical protein [Aurantiacibacter arachoides]GGD58559.1 hypothetical protein GCM10011411_18430 [Aurantiacibacter arachoides]
MGDHKNADTSAGKTGGEKLTDAERARIVAEKQAGAGGDSGPVGTKGWDKPGSGKK